jgi:hypothetical protein
MSKYAVLISGISAENSGCDEFWNDLVLMREALINYCRFPPANIYVLYGNGQDHIDPKQSGTRYDTQSNLIVTSAAKKADVTKAFNDLANKNPPLTNQDLLFIWTFGHGRTNILFNAYYLLLNDGRIDDTTFSSLVRQLNCTKVVCMQHCFSGGFIRSLKSADTIILTACTGYEMAFRCDNLDLPLSSTIENEIINNVPFHHGEFNYHLFSAITNNTIGGANVGTYDSKEFVTMEGVFNYLKKKDSIWWGEAPQYQDGANARGNIIHLQESKG